MELMLKGRVFLFMVLVGLLLPHLSQAASLYIDPPFSNLYRGDAVTLSVRLDVDEETGECVNAVDTVISYPDNIDPVDVSIGGSIFSIWVERPVINKENRTITFAGGIPNGYCGRVAGDPRLTNVLAELVFRSPGFVIGRTNDSNEATIEFTEDSVAYLNDGRGTKAGLRLLPASINLIDEVSPNIANDWQDEIDADDIRPEEFSIILEKGSGLKFTDRYYIVFNTVDKQTGIDRYQVMEEPNTQFASFEWGRADAPWVDAVSPYVLEDQSLNSIIRVRALDKAGNEYVATIVPDDSLRSMSNSQLINLMLIVFTALVAVSVLVGIVMYIRKRRQEAVTNVDEYHDEEFESQAKEIAPDEELDE